MNEFVCEWEKGDTGSLILSSIQPDCHGALVSAPGGVGCSQVLSRGAGVCDLWVHCMWESRVKWGAARGAFACVCWGIFGVMTTLWCMCLVSLYAWAHTVQHCVCACVWLTVCPSIAIRWRNGPTPISWSHGTSRWTSRRSSLGGTLLREIKSARWRSQATVSDNQAMTWNPWVRGSRRRTRGEGGRSNTTEIRQKCINKNNKVQVIVNLQLNLVNL